MLNRFYRRDTSTIIQVRNTSDPEVPFIAFTICPDYHSSYKQDVLAKHNITVDNYRNDAMWYPNENDSNFNAKVFFHEITHEIHEIVEKIEISTMSMNQPKVIVEMLKELGQKYVEFTTQYTDTYGRCYTMSVTESLKILGITKIKFTTRMNVYIFLDHPGQHLHPNSRSKVSWKIYLKICPSGQLIRALILIILSIYCRFTPLWGRGTTLMYIMI